MSQLDGVQIGGVLYIGLVLLSIAIAVLLLTGTKTMCKGREVQVDFRVLDFVCMLMPAVGLVFSVANVGEYASMPFALGSVFLAPGYSSLRILRFSHTGSSLEWPVLSFFNGVVITPLLVFMLNAVHILSSVTLYSCLLVLCAAPLVLHATRVRILQPHTSFNLVRGRLLLFAVLLASHTCVIASLYPAMTGLPGLDIARHYSDTLLLIQAPSSYGSIYPWFHALWAAVVVLSGAGFALSATGLAYCGIASIGAFYLLVRAVSDDERGDRSLLATVLFYLTSGFGWLLFLVLIPGTGGYSSLVQLLGVTYQLTYWDVGYGVSPWLLLWFRPMTCSFGLFWVILYFLGHRVLKQKSAILLVAMSTFGLGLIHVPELILLAFVIVCLALAYGNKASLHIRDLSIGITIGSIVWLLAFPFTKQFGGVLQLSLLATSLVIVGLSILAFSLSARPRFSFVEHIFRTGTTHAGTVVTLFILLFAGAALSWLLSAQSFSSTRFVETYFMPLVMLPVLLGTTGLLALLQVRRGALQRPPNSLLFLVLALSVFLFGKALSAVNLVFDAGYGERRFFPFIFGGACVFASSYLTSSRLRKSLADKKAALAIIVLILLAGTGSTVLTYTFWSTRLPTESPDSIGVVDFLSSSSNRDPITPILTISDSTRTACETIPTPNLIDRYRLPIWGSAGPELPMTLIYNKAFPPPYVVVSNDELGQIPHEYENGFLARYLPSAGSSLYGDSAYRSIALANGTPPSAKSGTVIVKCTDCDGAETLAELLSSANLEFTTCEAWDYSTIADADILLFSCDSDETLQVIESRYVSEDQLVVIFSLGDPGPIAESVFEYVGNETIHAYAIVSGADRVNLTAEATVSVKIARPGVTEVSYYLADGGSSPFAVECLCASRNVTYIDVKPVLHAAVSPDFVLDSRAVMDLQMTNRVRNTIPDTSPLGNTAYVSTNHTGESISPLGYVLDLENGSPTVRVNDSDSLDLSGPLSVEVWLRLIEPSKGHAILCKKTSYSSISGYSLTYDGSSFYFNFGNGSNVHVCAVAYESALLHGWHHLVFTYDLSRVRLYLDGLLIGSTAENATIAASSDSLLIGSRFDGFWPMSGQVARTVLYSAALDDTQISDSANDMQNQLWSGHAAIDLLARIPGLLDLPLPSHSTYEDWVYTGDTGFFSTASLVGPTYVDGASVCAIVPVTLCNGLLSTPLSNYTITDLLLITIDGSNTANINCSEVRIQSASGFYANVTIVDPVISFELRNSTLTVLDSGPEAFNTSARYVTVSIEGTVNTTIRTPCYLSTSGYADIRNLYSLFSSYPDFRCNGQELTVNGTVSFTLILSDAWSFVTNLRASGCVLRNPPVLEWNELGSVLFAIECTMPLVAVYGVWYLVRTKRKMIWRSRRETHDRDVDGQGDSV